MTETHEHDIARRVGRRFARPWHRDYARAKLAMDPAYAAAAQAIEAGGAMPLLDVGCGMGLLGFYLRERGWQGDYLGVDFDPRKLAAGRAATRDGERIAFHDGRAQALPVFAGNVALIDVLHYLERDAQRVLLAEAAARVAPGACLVVRNVLRDRSWRFRATVAEEWLIHAIRWMRAAPRHYPLREEIEQPLRDAGLEVAVQPLWGRTPFNSFLAVARRPAASR